MSLVFHFAPMTSAVTTHWVLEELGIPYDKVKLDLAAGDTRKPAHLAINPNGKVPVIVHDGVPIFESVAIAIYLGETFGVASKLFPEPGPARGQAMAWIAWATVSLGGAVARIQLSSSPRIPAERHNAKAAEAARAEVDELLAVLDGVLARSTYLLGNEFTIVDAHTASWTAFLGMMGHDLKKHAHVDAWSARCTARPAFKTVMQP